MTPAFKDLNCTYLLIPPKHISQIIGKSLLEWLTTSLDGSSLGLKHYPGREGQPL